MTTTRLLVDVHGRGKVAVLLHGAPTHPYHLAPLAERLSTAWKTLVVHLPGYGRSAPLRPYDLDESHALVERTLCMRRRTSLVPLPTRSKEAST